MQAGGPGADTEEELRGIHQGGTPIGLPAGSPDDPMVDANGNGIPDSLEGVPGSRQAADGKHYVKKGNGYLEVEPVANEAV